MAEEKQNWYEEMLKKHPEWRKDVERLKEPKKEEAPQALASSVMDAKVPAAKTREPLLNALRAKAGVQAPEFNPAPNVRLSPQAPAAPDLLSAARGLANDPNMQQPDEQTPEEPQQPDEVDQESEDNEPDVELAKQLEPAKEAPSQAPQAPAMQAVNFQGPTEGILDKLRAAQAAKAKIQHISNLGRSFDLLGAGLARAQPVAQEFYKDLAKQGEQQEVDLNNLMEREKSDPNSAVSKGFKEYLKLQGLDLQGNASAKDAAALLPDVYKRYHDLVANKAKADIARNAQEQAQSRLTQSLTSQEKRAKEANEARIAAAKLGAETAGENRKSREDLRITGLANQVTNRIDQDKVVQPMQQNYESLDKADNLLNNKSLPVTPQVLSDAETDLTAALTIRGQTGITEGKVKRAQIETLNRKIAEAVQTWGNQPGIDLRKEDPALVEQVLKTIKALKDDNAQAIHRRKNQLLEQYKATSGDDPRFVERLRKLQEQHNKEFESRQPQSLDKPKTVIQHGHTYTLNPQTGKYE